LYRDLRELGYENLGVVVQAYLRRTIDDVEGVDNVRLCKGIYVEPPAIAYREFEAVRANYLLVLEKLLAQGSFVGIATHDEYLIVEALRRVRGLPADRYEFQMLLGVRPDRADALVGAGHRVRIYVPYGTQWYEYSLRRLQENPKIAGYVAGDTLNKLLRRPS
jgi:proline dehydrogenase